MKLNKDEVELQWLQDWGSLKEGLQTTLNASGQLLKRYYSSKDLVRPQRAKDIIHLPVDLVNHHQINPHYLGPEAEILTETASFIAIHKPVNIHTHPLCYSDQDTALNFLVTKEKWHSLNVNPASYDRGLLFRLDYETSGVLVLAKTEAYFSKYRQSFHLEMKRKLYWAIVEGDFDREGRWTHYFKATGVKGAKQKVLETSHADAEAGSLKVVKLFHHEGKSLVLVSLGTGIRHQIRAQLAALGFPILGDELYGGRKSTRLFLHAWRYEWDDVFVESNRPELFSDFVDLDRALQVGHDVIRRF